MHSIHVILIALYSPLILSSFVYYYRCCCCCCLLLLLLGCSLMCHTNCAESIPNTCGLPQPLALQICPLSPPKKTRHDDATPDSTAEGTSSACTKENIPLASKVPKRLSIDLIRCQIATPSSVVSPAVINQPVPLDKGDVFSITSSMLEESGDSVMDDSDYV